MSSQVWPIKLKTTKQYYESKYRIILTLFQYAKMFFHHKGCPIYLYHYSLAWLFPKNTPSERWAIFHINQVTEKISVNIRLY